MIAKECPVGTKIEIRSERVTLTLAHGRKPWRWISGRGRFSHAEVQGSIDAGDVRVLHLPDVAPV